MLLLVVASGFPAHAADLAPGLSPALFKQLDAMTGKAVDAYNKQDSKKFYADYAKQMSAIATPQTFQALYGANGYMKTVGTVKTRKFAPKKSAVNGAVAILVYDATFSKGAGVVNVNFIKEGNAFKIQQVQFAKH
jgi:hypothetical protein